MRSYASAGTLIIRIVLGIVFLAHGLDKFSSGIGNIEGFFQSIGIPAFMASIVAVIEIVGGIALILGLATRAVSVILGIVLIVAILQAKLGAGFLGGYELDLALLAMAAHLALSGSSLLALDSLFFKRSR